MWNNKGGMLLICCVPETKTDGSVFFTLDDVLFFLTFERTWFCQYLD